MGQSRLLRVCVSPWGHDLMHIQIHVPQYNKGEIVLSGKSFNYEKIWYNLIWSYSVQHHSSFNIDIHFQLQIKKGQV